MTQRLGIGHAVYQTPYEHTRLLVSILPETQPYVEPLTDEYVHYRFARHAPLATPASQAPADAKGDPELLQKWQAVEPIFWRAWLRKLRDRVVRPKSNVYQLVDEDRPQY